MKILLVSFEFPPHTHTGGIGSYMFHLANLLGNNNHEVTVFSAFPAGEIVTTEINDTYRHYCIPAENEAAFRINAAVYFDEYIKNNGVDIMESPEVGACAIGIKRKYPSIPLIVKLHTPGVLINRVSRYYQPLSQKLRFVVGSMLRGKWDAGYWSHSDKDQLKDKEYLITAMADAILSPSVALKKWAVKFWKLQPEKISVVPNPFTPDSELFGYPFDGRPPIITFVGKLSILKGLIGFTAAIPMILDKYPGYKLKIVGRDTVEDGKSMLKYMKTKLSAYLSRIEFTGALPAAEVHKIYSTSRLCIMPSLWENYPTVILEAMAAGCPVIATNKGGIPEMIEHGKTGLLFDAKSTKDLLKQTGLILENKNIRCEIAQNARIKLRENTLIDIGILNVYERFNKQRSA